MNLIPSIIWDDLYKATTCQAIFFQFPRVKARYKFYDREPNRGYPPGFAAKLQEEVNKLANLSLTGDEQAYLNSIRFIKPNFVEWFAGYRYSPSEVKITQVGNRLDITIEGLMYRAMWWEVKLMLLISALSLEDTPRIHTADILSRITSKRDRMEKAELYYIDFGTRRARSPDIQDNVVEYMKKSPFFRGTSNMYLAMVHKVPANGTVAHEWFMLMQGLYGFRQMNHQALEHWVDEYDGDLGIVLPDTLTTDFFLKTLTRKQAELWRGYRLDSGDCLQSAIKIAKVLKDKFQIEPESKIWVPSDGLTDLTAIEFQKGLRNAIGSGAKVTAGMGTFLSNDVAPVNCLESKPRKIVIKLDAVDVGNGWIDVIKLSDEPGKHTGNRNRIAICHEEIGYAA
jgi:nicotinate phosphoribosyltransferase